MNDTNHTNTNTPSTPPELNPGFPPLSDRPLNSSKDPHSLSVQQDHLFVQNLPLFSPLCSLLDCLSTQDLPSLNIHRELYLYVPHSKIQSLSYYGGKPSEFDGKILYQINAVFFKRTAADSNLVVTPIRVRDGDHGPRGSSIRNHPQLFSIKNLLSWASPDKILFFDHKPLKD